ACVTAASAGMPAFVSSAISVSISIWFSFGQLDVAIHLGGLGLRKPGTRRIVENASQLAWCRRAGHRPRARRLHQGGAPAFMSGFAVAIGIKRTWGWRSAHVCF